MEYRAGYTQYFQPPSSTAIKEQKKWEIRGLFGSKDDIPNPKYIFAA